MAGRRIRWASAGKAIAVGAAVLAAFASLPALLGGPDPQPLPEDVGLAGVAPEAPAPVEVPPPAAPPRVPGSVKRELEDRRTRERAQRGPSRPKRPDRRQRDRDDQIGEPSSNPPPPVSPLAVDVPRPPAPRPRREFHFER